MSPVGAALIAATGFAGGALNTLVGGGSLLTFPVLLALGFPPVTANITNSAGLLPGSAAGAWGYRGELPARAEMAGLSVAALAGGAAGAAVLLILPARAFTVAVPWLIGLATLLVVAAPRMRRQPPALPAAGVSVWAASLRSPAPMWSCPGPQPEPVRRRKVLRGACGHFHPMPKRQRRAMVFLGVLAAGMYGGYFSACQGVVFIGVLGAVRRAWGLQRVNAVKNVLATAALASAVALFASVGHVAWAAVVLLAAGSMAGGRVGAWAGRRMPSPVLRGVVVTIGVAAITRIVV